jgi:ribonuclease Z
LTVQESGVPNLTLHGPPGVEDIFKAMRRFVILKELNVDTVVCGETQPEFYEDSVLTVSYLPLYKPKSETTATDQDANKWDEFVDTTDYYAGMAEGSKKSPSPTGSISANFIKTRREEEYVMSYVCRLKPKPGMLCLEKCVDRGVPPGPLLGQLKNGLDVTLPDGTVVKSADVTLPDDQGPVFICKRFEFPST